MVDADIRVITGGAGGLRIKMNLTSVATEGG